MGIGENGKGEDEGNWELENLRESKVVKRRGVFWVWSDGCVFFGTMETNLEIGRNCCQALHYYFYFCYSSFILVIRFPF